ncbi:MAG: 4-alpha-glucanotransferase [Nitrospirae bacterium]|nr:4-alpha-glucanotransferase [Nitrospirota bacterium]
MGERSEQELLNDLAERYGIASDYYDYWGHRHPTSDQTKRAILAAMGVQASTADDVQRALAAYEEAPWRRSCDPVMVRPADGNVGLWSFRVPVAVGADQEVRILWEVTDESGHRRYSGEAGPGLVPAETRTVDGERRARFELPVPSGLTTGYYDLTARAIVLTRCAEGTLRLILVPPQCYVPPQFHQGDRIWGVALQLYALRSARNWGVGDLGDLAEFLTWAAKDLGAGVIGLNPLHALKNSRPYYISPYSPDSRLYLNVLYLDVERIPEYAESMAAHQLMEEGRFRSRLEAMRKSDEIDYDQVAGAKRTVLEALFKTFQERHCACQGNALQPLTERGRAFEQYVREEGELLEMFALFQALSEELRLTHPQAWVWQEWPEAYQHPQSPAVTAFRAGQQVRIRFHQYLQWVVGEQLRQVAGQARELGMPIGLYHDLALGSDRSGSDAWVFQDVFAPKADAGCPPDAFALEGQNWGLPPINPVRLRESGYRMFIELLRKNLKYGGALRLDHVMGLFRLFWIPRGMPASAGAYVRYPVEDLLGILALESVRHRAVIVGEDLGTVPDSVRARLASARVLSYRVFYFERWDDGNWKAPAAYPAQAMAVVATHDLPTLAGFWTGQDIEIRSKLGLYPDEGARRRALEQRQREKSGVLRALNSEGLLPSGLTEDPASAPEMTPELCRAIHVYLGRTPSWVVLASLEDVLGEVAQVNVPGTVDSYPNWSRKTALTLEDLREDPRPHQLAAMLREPRGLKK